MKTKSERLQKIQNLKVVKSMNAELKKVLGQVKVAQAKFQKILTQQEWVEDARKYAERQGKEVKKLLKADVSKVKSFIEKERKELEKFHKQIPGEVDKFRTFVSSQKKEFEKLLVSLRKTGVRTKLRKTPTRKKTAPKKTAQSSSAN